MSIDNIMKMPWIFLVIGMLDAPSVDYKSKKEEKTEKQANTASEEMAAIGGFLG